MNTQPLSSPGKTQFRCCVAGGGPAGLMVGFLLARAGIETVVLEKHGDFLRDFRGDTVHPSALEVLHELGLLEDFLHRPHDEARQITAYVGREPVVVADFSHLPTHCPFAALMPQWDFLNFLEEKGRAYPTFHVWMDTEVTGLIEEDGGVVGVTATTPRGPVEIHADLVIGADGRHSTVRQLAGLRVEDLGSPIDVLWLRLARHPDDPHQPLGYFDHGRVFVMLDRGDYWQCGYVIAKGGIEAVRHKGLDAFRQSIVEIAPFMSDRVGELKSWDDVKLLTVAVDRLRQWYRPGLLCIGDSAHAMSPIGGVGINLAIQDAVATANILAAPLQAGKLTPADLGKVQRRREFPTRVTQFLQVMIQDRVINRVLAGARKLSLPWPLRLLRAFPFLRRIPARLIGVGIRPEHVKTPEKLRSVTRDGVWAKRSAARQRSSL